MNHHSWTVRLGSSIPPDAGTPACTRLISGTTPSPREVIFLIEMITASKVELEAIRGLCGDDTQILIDVIHEVSFRALRFLRHRLIVFILGLLHFQTFNSR